MVETVDFATIHRKSARMTQRVIVPGGTDRVTSPPLGRAAFEALCPGHRIHIGGGFFVTRSQCFWDERYNTISLMPGLAPYYK